MHTAAMRGMGIVRWQCCGWTEVRRPKVEDGHGEADERRRGGVVGTTVASGEQAA